MRRCGFTLVELLMAIAITGLVAVMAAVLTSAVSTGGQHVQASQQASQQALAALDAIRHKVATVHATANQPGVVVVQTSDNGWQFSDTLVLWLPASGQPANPDGLPLVEELLLICPAPQNLRQLIQVRAVGDTREVSLWDLNTPEWQAELEQIKTSSTSQRSLLCQGLRVVTVSDGEESGAPPGAPPPPSPPGFSNNNGTGQQAAGVLFSVRYAPSQQELEEVASGTRNWDQVAWPQGVYSASTGLRQVWVSVELQLSTQATDGGTEVVLPFFGSATRYYQVNKDELQP